jgi:hypothetical protein
MLLSFLGAFLVATDTDRGSTRSRYLSGTLMTVALVTIIAEIWYDYAGH